jgi:uncharacterized membrane protein
MYKIEWKKEWALLAIMAAVTAAVMACYPRLPQILPMHWDINGHVNSVAPKSFISAFFHLGIIWGLYFLLLYLPFIDPKRDRYAQFLDAYRVIRYTIITFMCCISLLVTAWSLGYKLPVEKSIPVIVAFEFIFMGNMMGKIKMNWFVGMRLPWTMEDEEVWNRTNRLTGRLFVASGLLTIISVFFPAIVTFIVLIGSVTLTTAISIIYSFLLYKSRHK